MGFTQRCGLIGMAIAIASTLGSNECFSDAPHKRSRLAVGASAQLTRDAERQATGNRSLTASPIQLSRNGEGDEIAITTTTNEPLYKVLRLENPPRLVIDIESEKLSLSPQQRTATSASVKGVRVGTHPTKSRVVIDLTNAGIVHGDRTDGGKIVISLRAAQGRDIQSVAVIPQLDQKTETKEVAAQGVAQKQKAQQQKAMLTLDEEILTSGSSSREASPSKPQADVALVPPSQRGVSMKKAAHTGVASVALEKGKGAGESVVVGLSGSPEYSMTRTAPSEYVVTVKNAQPTDAITRQPLFNTSQDAAIRSVRTVIDGTNTLIRIFTNPGSYLTTHQAGDRLVIEKTQDLARVANDIRAQLAPDQVKAKEAAAKDGGDGKASQPAKNPGASPQGQAKADAQKPAAGKDVAGKEAAKSAADTKSVKGEPDEELAALLQDEAQFTGKLISLDLQDADIDSALRIIAEVSNLNIVATDGVVGKVTLKLVDVPWDQALDVILKSNGLDKVVEGNVMRVAPIDKLNQERAALKVARVTKEELEPIDVKYMRVSYAKAAEIKALVETVLSERGTVAFDERSNQLIVKDVKEGLTNVAELIKKVDLRTPQILLETQIVEAKRDLARELGSELGFQYIQSPSTGNGTGLNFPSAISLGGSAPNSLPGAVSAFPVSTNSAITMLFDSADGTKNLALRLSQLETEGSVRIVSKPAVATTNNKPAEIKSVEKYRIRLPNGGLSIATGSGAQSSGAGNVATETIEAGIVLNVTPQASPDYYILLDIKAKSSSFGAKNVEGIPNEIERSASSSVLVSSGQTFALGGIYKINENSSVSGVPFFKDIPVLGTFFRSSTTINSDEELLFFITPRVIEGSFEEMSSKVNS